MKKIVFLLILTALAYTIKATSLTVADSNVVKNEVPLPPPPPADHHYTQVDVNNEVPNIAYVMPIAFFVFVLLIVGFIQYFNYKRSKDRMHLYLKYLEHGKEVPVNLLVQPRDVSSNLKRGIILIAVGLGVTIFFFAESPAGTEWTIGIIPFLIGLGYLLVYKISSKTPTPPNE